MQPLPFTSSSDYTHRDQDLGSIRNIFISLFKWNNEANEEFIFTLMNLAVIPENCAEIMSHVINVHELWINRITNVQDTTLDPWNKFESTDLIQKNANNFYITLGLLGSEGYGKDFNWKFAYLSHRGVRNTCSISDAYFHILSHSSYHRGQVAFILREKKIMPPNTNIIMLNDGNLDACG